MYCIHKEELFDMYKLKDNKMLQRLFAAFGE